MRSLIYCTDAIDRRIKEKNENPIDEAIDACTRENILQDFFRTYKNEVRRIMALDFIFERQIELTKMEKLKE